MRSAWTPSRLQQCECTARLVRQVLGLCQASVSHPQWERECIRCGLCALRHKVQWFAPQLRLSSRHKAAFTFNTNLFSFIFTRRLLRTFYFSTKCAQLAAMDCTIKVRARECACPPLAVCCVCVCVCARGPCALPTLSFLYKISPSFPFVVYVAL